MNLDGCQRRIDKQNKKAINVIQNKTTKTQKQPLINILIFNELKTKNKKRRTIFWCYRIAKKEGNRLVQKKKQQQQ